MMKMRLNDMIDEKMTGPKWGLNLELLTNLVS